MSRPVEAPDLSPTPVAQHVAHAAARPTMRSAISPRQAAVQLMQHAGAREIEIGRCRQITDHQADVAWRGARSRFMTD